MNIPSLAIKYILKTHFNGIDPRTVQQDHSFKFCDRMMDLLEDYPDARCMSFNIILHYDTPAYWKQWHKTIGMGWFHCDDRYYDALTPRGTTDLIRLKGFAKYEFLKNGRLPYWGDYRQKRFLEAPSDETVKKAKREFDEWRNRKFWRW